MTDYGRVLILSACIDGLRRFEADGVTLVEEERERILAPPGEWYPTLLATHSLCEITHPTVRA